MNYTTSNLAAYLEVVLGRNTYHHEDSDIPHTGIGLVLVFMVQWCMKGIHLLIILFQDSLTMNYI
jgi:hypothetical protein